MRVSSDVMRMFRPYDRPGNFRQLHNLLRTAVVTAGEQGKILAKHLPDDFLEEVSSATGPLARHARIVRIGPSCLEQFGVATGDSALNCAGESPHEQSTQRVLPAR